MIHCLLPVIYPRIQNFFLYSEFMFFNGMDYKFLLNRFIWPSYIELYMEFYEIGNHKDERLIKIVYLYIREEMR